MSKFTGCAPPRNPYLLLWQRWRVLTRMTCQQVSTEKDHMTLSLDLCDMLLLRRDDNKDRSVYYKHLQVRDWSLIMGRGGACEVLPLRKGGGGGGGKSFSHAEGGTKRFEVVFMR